MLFCDFFHHHISILCIQYIVKKINKYIHAQILGIICPIKCKKYKSIPSVVACTCTLFLVVRTPKLLVLYNPFECACTGRRMQCSQHASKCNFKLILIFLRRLAFIIMDYHKETWLKDCLTITSTILTKPDFV